MVGRKKKRPLPTRVVPSDPCAALEVVAVRSVSKQASQALQ